MSQERIAPRPTRQQRIDRKRRELDRLKAELRKARSPIHAAYLTQEIRAVARELIDLSEKL